MNAFSFHQRYFFKLGQGWFRRHERTHLFLKKLNLKKFITGFQVFLETKKWRPQGDSNPRRRRERAVSWAWLDDGDFLDKQYN